MYSSHHQRPSIYPGCITRLYFGARDLLSLVYQNLAAYDFESRRVKHRTEIRPVAGIFEGPIDEKFYRHD